MRLVVCLKQVPDPYVIRYDYLNDEIKCIEWVLDSGSFSALEEALKLKDKFQAELIALSVGPVRVDRELKKALLYGADRAIRVWQDWLENADTFVISSVIADVLKELKPDLVFCGARSDDTSTEFVGAALAEKLDMALVTRVREIEEVNRDYIVVHKKLEKGEMETYAVEVPAVITVEVGDFKYPLPHGERLRMGLKKEIEVYTSSLNPVKPLIDVITPATKPKPRIKVRKTVGMSPEEMMRLMRGKQREKRSSQGIQRRRRKK